MSVMWPLNSLLGELNDQLMIRQTSLKSWKQQAYLVSSNWLCVSVKAYLQLCLDLPFQLIQSLTVSQR